MEKPTRNRLIFAALAAAVLFVGALAWNESRYPLRYLDAGRVHTARVEAVRGRRARELSAEETAELCRLLSSARHMDSFEGARAVRVELGTVDYGQVNVYDFGGGGANLLINAGRPEQEIFSVRSSALGEFLERLAGELAAGDEKEEEPPAAGG